MSALSHLLSPSINEMEAEVAGVGRESNNSKDDPFPKSEKLKRVPYFQLHILLTFF